MEAKRGSRILGANTNRRPLQEIGNHSKEQDIHLQGIGTGQNQEADKDLLELQELMKYWFLIDKKLICAIRKGNVKLIPVAKARIDFQVNVVQPELLKQGLHEQEGTLCNINVFLHNNGWWLKVENLAMKLMGLSSGITEEEAKSDKDILVRFILLNFIKDSKQWVEPSVFFDAFQGNDKAISLALG